MAGAVAANVTFDVYRGYAPATPYSPPNRPAILAGIGGFLRNHVENGRFGYLIPGQNDVPIYWTNILEVALGTDARDAYDSELNADTIRNGDTIMVADYPVVGACTAFVCVMVQRRNRQNAGDHVRLYLDRAQPQWGQACPDPTQGGGIQTSCCPDAWPATLYATLANVAGCDCASGTIALTFNPATGKWTGSGPFGTCGRNITITFYCLAGGVSESDLVVDVSFSDNCFPALSGQTGTQGRCSPLLKTYPFGLAPTNLCGCQNVPLVGYQFTVTQ
jgi:hypothetical protein